jgi:mRNA interferase MazF
MLYRRGDVIAVPFNYSDLTGRKLRPALIVSSETYNLIGRDVVAAGISTKITKASPYDHILAYLRIAGLRYPSLVRGRLLTIEQRLIRYTIGHLSPDDLSVFENKLAAFLLSDIAVANYLLTRIDLTNLPGRVVQALAEKSIQASRTLESRGDSALDIARLRALLST